MTSLQAYAIEAHRARLVVDKASSCDAGYPLVPHREIIGGFNGVASALHGKPGDGRGGGTCVVGNGQARDKEWELGVVTVCDIPWREGFIINPNASDGERAAQDWGGAAVGFVLGSDTEGQAIGEDRI